jgi:hypothetical protein
MTQLAWCAAQLQPVAISTHGDAGRIVSAILKPAQPLDDDRDHFRAVSNVSNNAAHNLLAYPGGPGE